MSERIIKQKWKTGYVLATRHTLNIIIQIDEKKWMTKDTSYSIPSGHKKSGIGAMLFPIKETSRQRVL